MPTYGLSNIAIMLKGYHAHLWSKQHCYNVKMDIMSTYGLVQHWYYDKKDIMSTYGLVQCCGSETIYSRSGSREKFRIHADPDPDPTCIN